MSKFPKPKLLLSLLSLVTMLALQTASSQDVLRSQLLERDLKTVRSLIRVKDFDRALSVLAYMKNAYGEDPRIIDDYKEVYKHLKLYPKLEKLIADQLLKSPSDPILIAQLGEVKFLQNDQVEADSLWNRALEIGSRDEYIYRLVASYKLRYGLYEDAIETYTQGREVLSNPALFSRELAEIYESQRHYSKAVDEYITQLQNDRKQMPLVSMRIRGLVEDADDPSSIIEAVKKRLGDSVSYQDILYEILGELHLKLNQMGKALEYYQLAGKQRKDDGRSLVGFAQRCYESGAYATAVKAIREYFASTKTNPLRDKAMLLESLAERALENTERSLNILSQLCLGGTDPETVDKARFLKGEIYAEDVNDCQQAIEIWKELLSQPGPMQSPLRPELENRCRVEMATCYTKMGQLGVAESLLTEAVGGDKVWEKNEKALFMLADIAFFTGDYKRAKELFERLVYGYPQGDHANDAVSRITVITLAGDDETEQRPLKLFASAMMEEATGHPEKAAEILSDERLRHSPIAEQVAFYSALAYAHASMNPEAIGAFQGYIDEYPDGLYVDRAYLGMGDIYMRSPDTYRNASLAYKKILEDWPDGPVAEIARQRLRELESLREIG